MPSARIRACAVAYDGSRGCRESSANFSVVMAPPYVGILSPAEGAENVSLDAPIVIVFDPPPDPTTFQWPVILPPVPLLVITWTNGDTVLVLQHHPFAECTLYSVFLTNTDPSPDPTVWRFTTLCPSPRVLDFGFVAAVNGSVWVSFNKPMDRLETYATISPEVPLTATWNANNTYVTLRPSPSFEPCTIYTAQLFGGKDLLGNPGVVEPGPIPNPFSFTTECLSPVTPDVTDTNPANATVDVPIIAPVFVNFSRSMDTASVQAVFSPVVTVNYTWTNNNMTLRLNHATLFTECTGYTVTVSGNDTNGNSLGPGVVPNPWSFSTVCPVFAPGNLQVSRVEPDVVRLTWNAAASADSYRVYESSSRFAIWPWAVLGTTTATSFDAIPHLTDGATHYYIVRAVRSFAVSGNSTMGAKIQMNVAFNTATSNIRWFSLPYRSDYAKASDITNELGSSKIDVIAKWNPATQTPTLYYYFRGAWRGTDFSIAAGDGLYLGSGNAFSWVIVGTDRAISMSFTLNDGTLGDVNWISLPWAGAYRSARDIVIDIEGSTGPGASTRIIEIAEWDYSSQRLVTYRWTTAGWTGSDFAVTPGDGAYLRVAAAFDWQPRLLQPPVPGDGPHGNSRCL